MIGIIFKKAMKNATQIRNVDMIFDMMSNKTLNPMVTELFIRGRKLNLSLVFVTQSCFCYTILLCCTRKHQSKFYALYYYENSNKQELQQIAFNHSSDNDFQNFISLYKNVLQNHIPYQLLMLILHQIIFYLSEKILQKESKTNHDN